LKNDKNEVKLKKRLDPDIMITDLKFFTNEPEGTLLERFRKILENNTEFFDVLVGYFRSSGFFKLYKSLENVKKIRILVGLNVDRSTYQMIRTAQDKSKELWVSSKNAQDAFMSKVQEEMEESEDDKNVEEGVKKFIEFIRTGKLEIRIYPKHPIHAKVYIIRKNPEKSEHFGQVITGSSNFSEAGLVDNLEFNVELKDAADVKFALKKFEELWEEGVDISEKYIETVQTKTWLNDEITPYDLYIKLLYEYFREKINYDEMFADLPKGFLDLEYQKEAVADAYDKIKQHNGVFLSDVVGLGKTFISALLAKKLGGHSLVICPPVLKEYWEETMRQAGVVAKVESHGKLDQILLKGVEEYDNVFIDEAHRFRNEITQSFEKLHQICAGKKVILVSATPLNNRPKDIASQLYLFQNKLNSTIPNLKNLKRFFSRLEKRLDSKLEKEEYLRVVKENSREIRERILKHVMVRRTRTEVEKFYKEDLEKQGVKFPTIKPPVKLFYQFDEELNNLFDKTLQINRKIHYARYTPSKYLKEKVPTEDLQIQLLSQENIRGFMRSLLVKRLESSFYAFRQTLRRFIESYDNFIKMFDAGTVYISKKIDVYDYLERGFEDELLKLVDEGRAIKYESRDFIPEFRDLLVYDRKTLQELLDAWEKINYDPKIEKFISVLQKEEVLKNENTKIIVFTESEETGRYLREELNKIYPNKVIFVSSRSSAGDIKKIKENFDPSSPIKKNDIRILIATDILSEGVNLHKANVVVNYDLPWNSTRILQRVGRVNRIGTKHDSIYIYNFFPTEKAESEIRLEKLAVAKIQAFHDTLGEDAKYLTQEEEFKSHELFNRINSKDIFTEEDENTASELAYLKFIRKIRDEQPALFEKVKRLPKKARTARKGIGNNKSVLTFFRRGELKKFFIANKNGVREIDFLEAADILKASPKTPKENIPDYYHDFLTHNKEAFEKSIEAEKDIENSKSITGNERIFLRLIKALESFSGLTEEDEWYLENLKKAVEEGSISKRLINKVVKSTKDVKHPLKIFHIIKENITERYLENLAKREGGQSSGKREIILSEVLL